MKQEQTTVAVAYDLNFRQAGEIFRGVSDHVRESGLDWRLLPLQYGFETTLMQLARSGQLSGAIGTFISDRWIAGLIECGVQAVNLLRFSEIRSIPGVCLEDFEMGRLAAGHLLQQGASQFIYFASDGVHFNELRRRGFLQALGNHPCTTLKPGPLLNQQIANINYSGAQPGVFCASDRLARQYILEARQLGLECGRHFLLASIDNDPTESVFAGTGITSFEPPMHACGTLAAKLLQEALAGMPPPTPAVHLVGPARLIVRDSSLPSRTARIAQAALNHINEHFTDPALDAAALARAVGVSRRVLELSLRGAGLFSPYQAITHARLQHARHLLASTDLSVAEAGRRSGYPEPHHFSAWFKTRNGQSPRQYRLQAKTPSV